MLLSGTDRRWVQYLFLGHFEDKYVYNIGNYFVKYLQLYLCSRDYVLIVWLGTTGDFGDFIVILDYIEFNMQFTSMCGGNQIKFLNVLVT